jgi:hypothetical protein
MFARGTAPFAIAESSHVQAFRSLNPSPKAAYISGPVQNSAVKIVCANVPTRTRRQNETGFCVGIAMSAPWLIFDRRTVSAHTLAMASL